MSKLMLCTVLLFVALTLNIQRADAGYENLRIFCSTLNQTLENTNSCYEAPRLLDFSSPHQDVDMFILAYTCCLNAHTEVITVTYDYMPFLEFEFLGDIIVMTNEITLIDIAKFLQMCNKVPNKPYRLSDYNFWAGKGRNESKCKRIYAK
ncbi:uncharacterized protein LOC106056944 isoform X2 [Biomphalaria glabrata]|uniref:Uncharacterized protein LOC106056944 isoform X2 n=1 Tax=Biomphalaria glabrata TaxID=6526 RepID=A0A9U8E2J6_BIOGL|nr:uncharacterized protein LOC106056944 isoform X2 [Biomphalaria glabrata]